MSRFSIIHAPSILGLKPSGVEHLPDALREAGLHEALEALYEGSVFAPPFDRRRDPETLVLNPHGIKAYSKKLSKEVERIIRSGLMPVVLGGDCSILIGNLLALRRLGRYGLFFLDGHADFYQPQVEPNGEVASMDLAIVTGRGPDILTNIDGLKPLVRDEDTVVFGYRDAELAERDGSPDVRSTEMYVRRLDEVRQTGGARNAAVNALSWLIQKPIDGFWIHLDVDVLDDALMPAVDYRMPDGLSFEELAEVLKVLISSPKAVGIEITIFNPSLDSDGSIARNLTEALVAGLAPKATP